ncbi:MAG: microviridin/marinostatin family tricyclic proteinase inhibitor [Moorea sp. SIOASIH]|uniref:microviridin/marinostatin family tricyclic proteinase inhibitor n=1 Tax=Moorena sp. SIOASIH TaxID=2607817 RepID=UPI0013B8B986|nr:microviridin/marinostatin family tricyclic proteinase inhibitor [Moorena sp. SIOASIH]NEO38098.1 microviridin/marinostatin family tricyclic proteinase inhibitor [Moorena sp. SIOASIH]
MQNQESNTQVKPFFAHFLEEQKAAPDQSETSGQQTLKYPSDSEEIETQKYPSDWEEN